MEFEKFTKKSDNKNTFSIIIPTWNNLEYLKNCVYGIKKNSNLQHQIIIHVNDGSDGTLEWVKKENLDYTHTHINVGVCYAVNLARTCANTDYILYMNDDMYPLPDWDKFLWEEIQKIGNKNFFLSSTQIVPNNNFNNSRITNKQYGDTIEDFQEEKLLQDYKSFEYSDWFGATWPPNVVHKDIWDLVGGYSIEFSPGMGSDPDFSKKLWDTGIRLFKGVSASRVYHFDSKSISRRKLNNSTKNFTQKWRLDNKRFENEYLLRGTPYIDTITLKEPTGLKNKWNKFKDKLSAAYFNLTS